MALVDVLDALNLFERLTGVERLAHPDQAGVVHPGRRVQWERRRGGLAGRELERVLAVYGIPVWDRHVTATAYWCHVPEQQGDWAEYLLGCLLEHKPLPPAWRAGGKGKRR